MRRIITLLLMLLCGLVPAISQQIDDSKSVQVYLQVEPVEKAPQAAATPGEKRKFVLGEAVRIVGLAGRDLAGVTLTITVTPPTETAMAAPGTDGNACPDDDPALSATAILPPPMEPVVLTAEVGRDGGFELPFTPQRLGSHGVEAAAPNGAVGGSVEFDVIQLVAGTQCEPLPVDEIDEIAADLTDIICKATDVLVTRVSELPASPARDELERQLKEIAANGKEAVPCGEAPLWVVGFRHLERLRKTEPSIRPAIEPVSRQIGEWVRDAAQARAQGREAIARMTHGNLVCDQLDIVINGLKFVDFYLGLVTKSADFLKEWANENVPTKLIGMLPVIKRRSAAVREGIEFGWKGVTTYNPKLEGGRVKVSTKGMDLAKGHQKMVLASRIYIANRVFEAFCQTFQGPIDGKMTASFDEGKGVWWSYSVRISGQLVLRYPKGASGKVIALTGEFVGNARSLDSWDNAVPVLYPQLAQGTVFRTERFEPQALESIPGIFQKNFGITEGSELPDFNPVTSMIEQGGVITQYVMTPAFFRIPVRAELREKSLRVELLPAVVDFDDLRVKVVHIMLPVLSLWPEVISYALPYRGAHLILTRAMNDGPATFEVVQTPNALTIERVFVRDRNTAETSASYSLTVRACNPGCP